MRESEKLRPQRVPFPCTCRESPCSRQADPPRSYRNVGGHYQLARLITEYDAEPNATICKAAFVRSRHFLHYIMEVAGSGSLDSFSSFAEVSL
jgi:hypothetical protein